MPPNRNNNIGAIWADGAPDPPGVPVAGVTYADSGLTPVEIEGAWPFQQIVASAKFNELMRRMTSIMKDLEEWGILPWCADVTYAAGARVMGTDNKIYRATNATTGDDPVSAPAGNWTLDNLSDHAALQATDALIGHIELATQAEVDAGSDAVRAVTPATLNGKTATETRRGVAEVGTQAETDAGADDTVIVTPKKLRWGFAISLGVTGYVKFPSWMGGLTFQWGTVTHSSDTQTFALATNFDTAALQAFACMGTNAVLNSNIVPISITTTQIQIFNDGGALGYSSRYFAIGY